jgi:hypothetical protein
MFFRPWTIAYSACTEHEIARRNPPRRSSLGPALPEGGDPVRQFFAQIRVADIANRSKT